MADFINEAHDQLQNIKSDGYDAERVEIEDWSVFPIEDFIYSTMAYEGVEPTDVRIFGLDIEVNPDVDGVKVVPEQDFYLHNSP